MTERIKNKYRWLALDLDGTLTNSEKKVSQKNIDAIHRAQEAGVNIVLASGRPVLGIEHIARTIGLYETGGYILAYNGAHVIECKSGKTIFKEYIPLEYVPIICEVNQLYEVGVLSYDSVSVISEDIENKYVQLEGFNNGIPVTRVSSLVEAIQEPVVNFMVVGEPEEVAKAQAYLSAKLEGKLNVFLSEPYFLEITLLGIEKASALDRFLQEMGSGPKELMAIGDGYNDMPMLTYAGYAVAMGNAHAEVKAIADEVTLTNDEDGVAESIYRVF